MFHDTILVMPERLYQAQFDENLLAVKHQEVTPKTFTGLYLPRRRPELNLTPNQPAPELGRFVREVKTPYLVDSPGAAAEYLLKNIYSPFEKFDQEEMWVLLLNIKNTITHEVMVYRGAASSIIIRTGELFKEAVRANATGIIMSHNHPSGDPTPSSPEDVQTTRSVVKSGKLLGVEVVDHIIIGGQNQWVSMRERGLGFDH